MSGEGDWDLVLYAAFLGHISHREGKSLQTQEMFRDLVIFAA